MPRKILPKCSFHPFHISARCLNRAWFDIPIEEVWIIYENYLHFIHHSFKIEILSFVLMGNHFHSLLRAPEANLSSAMNYFMRETSREIGRRAGRINQTYGTRFSRTLISTNHHFLCAYKYVYRNPIEAGLCVKVEEYPFSSLGSLLGLRKSIIPLVEDLTLFSDFEGTLKWLNTPRDQASREAVRRALRRNVFEFAKNKAGELHSLSTDLY